MTSINAKQMEFIQTHLGKNYKGKNKDRQDRLTQAWNRLTTNRDRSLDIVDQVDRVAATKEDREFVTRQKKSISDAMTAVNQAKIKSLKQSLAVIETADTAVQQHRQESMKYLLSAGQSGRDLDTEDEIARAKAVALAEWTSVSVEFDEKLQGTKDKLREETGVEALSLGISADFSARMKVFRTQIEGVPQRGTWADPVVAQEALDDIVANMRTLLSGAPTGGGTGGVLQTIEEVNDSELLAFFIESVKRQTMFNGQMDLLNGHLDTLNRWDTDTYPALNAKAKDMTKIAGTVFKPFKALVEGETDALGETEENLIIDARREIISAQRAISAAENAFDEPKRALEAEYNLLEARMAAVRKSVDKEQRAPIEAYLAALKNAIVGLGGFNVDALKPARAMMVEATSLVAAAEQIKVINTGIESVLAEAATTASAFKDKANALAEVAVELIAEIKTFKKTYKTLAISDAQVQVDALKVKASEEKARNDALVAKRADVQTGIDNAERMLTDFNAKFREMLAHANRDVKDYSGSFRADLDTCISWNQTKTQPDFYDTIHAKLASLTAEVGVKMTEINDFLKTPMDAQERAASVAATKYAGDTRDLKERLGKETDEDKRAELYKELADLKAAYEDETKGMGLLYEFAEEMAASEADMAVALRQKELYIQEAAEFLKKAAAEVKDKTSVLHAYKDEVVPQINRVKTTYDLVRGNKPGADGQIGRSELGFVKKFLDSVRARGEKTKKTELGNIGAQWATQVKGLSDATKALMDEIVAFENMYAGQKHDTSAKIETILKELISRVDTPEFTRAGTQMATAQDRQAVKAARELALSEIRRCRAVLLNDKVFQKCVMNPFKVRVGSEAANRLDQIELNVLRGV
ncbi:hypothetical protein ACERZ8_20235 [Tateyamaria armeniaca]|uniref:Uncharacterized protein n=1 Tax=Tateyamaria armeniaca TaxID=2518930 RepID=A0ABW8V1M5_9RHOB